MKKIGLLALILIIIFIVFKSDGNSDKKENLVVENKVENTVENTAGSEQVVLNENATKVEYKTNPLNGKTIAFIGDSLIEGYGNNLNGVDDYLAQNLPNTRFINNSKSGSTITDNSGTDNIIMLNQARTLSGNPDIIMFDGGANDIMGYNLGFLNNDLKKEIGTVDMTTTSISGGDTVISDFEEIIFELKNRFPNAKLCYLQPFLLDDDTINHLTNDEFAKQEIKARRDSFYGQMQKICEKWKMDYLDVSNHFIGTGLDYRFDDWIHIKHEGYQLLTPHIINKLKEI